MLNIQYCAQAGFEAARQLHGRPAPHPQARLHGHSFVARLRAHVAPGWAQCPGAEVEQLQQHLEAVTAALDHRLLNDSLPEPDDAALARWLQQRLHHEGLQGVQIGLQSTPRSGCTLDASGGAHTWRRYRFEAAHQLPRVPAGHKCGRMHGHGFEALLHVRADGGEAAAGVADAI
jgi:6-pyruvoyltetrahydropterin/6-carboxytetrahydropterin synthase